MSSSTACGPWARPFRLRGIILLAVAVVPLFLAGCGTLENGHGWGQEALWPVDLERVRRAACDALLSPRTLVPLAGAAVFTIDDFDERVSDWASERNPIFGSQNGAEDASDYLNDLLRLEVIGTALATPSGDEPDEWVLAKLKGGAVELGAVVATSTATSALKDASDRTRPDRRDDRSFPSGHSSHAFSYATLANRNLESIARLEGVRPVLQVGNTVLASGVAWARVEAARHYPSDVLFGAALGHFLTAFLHDAFLNLPQDERDQRDRRVDLAVFTTHNGAGLSLCFHF